MKKLLIPFLFLFFSASAAEYKGQDIDGTNYNCTAYSYSTGNYYYVTVEFQGSDCYIYFSNGGYITVTLDEEVIEDPSSISAYCYNNGVYWVLDVDLD